MSEHSEKRRAERKTVKSAALPELEPRHKKEAQTRAPKKSNHKHHWEQCVLEFERQSFSMARGVVLVPDRSFCAYCPVCGKLNYGATDRDRWWYHPDAYHCVHSDEALRELDPKTRTLPSFHVDDPLRTKFVEVEEASEEK